MTHASLAWHIGNVTITSFVEIPNAGEVIQEILPEASPARIQSIEWLRPSFADDHGKLKAVVQAFVLATPNLRVMVDTCIGDGRARPDLPAWQNLQTGFLQRLSAGGYPPDTIDVVLCTHLHFDHVGWNTTYLNGSWAPTFSRARYLFARDEFQYWKERPSAEIESDHNGFQDSVLPIIAAGRAELISTDHHVTDEISLIPTPGHTPAHVSVLIRSAGVEGLITGDVMHHPCQIAQPEWATLSDTNKDQARATREALLRRVVDKEITVIGSHFAPPTAGRVRTDGIRYRFHT